jgi:hypothetical protein
MDTQSRDRPTSSFTLSKQNSSNELLLDMGHVRGACNAPPSFFTMGSDCTFSATKMNAIVAGQTSVKSPEKDAFEKHLPQDVHIVSCHSLHGPTVSPVGQPLV